MKIHAFADSERLGREIAHLAGADFSPIELHRFPDGESLPRIAKPSGREAGVVRSLHDPNAKLIEVILAADALRRAGAKHVTLVTPYMPYMRQDRLFRVGEPISQRAIGEVLRHSFDRLVTLEPHLHRTPDLSTVFPGQADALSAAPAIARWVGVTRYRDFVIVGPDAESAHLVEGVSARTGLAAMVGAKRRSGDREVSIRFIRKPKARGAIIVDDIASSGATLAACVRTLRRMKIPVVDVVVVHALFEAGAIPRVRRAGCRRIVSCDTIPHFTNRIATAELFARSLTREADPARPVRSGIPVSG